VSATAGGNAETLEIAEGSTLWELVTNRAALTPGRMMLADEKGRTLTFAEFRAQAERVAAGLMARGIGPGSVVAWQLPTKFETVLLSMALARLGAVQVPIIALYREREVGSLLRNTGATTYVVPGVWRGFDYVAMGNALAEAGVAPQGFEVMNLDDGLPEADPATLPPPPTDGEAIRWLYSTSGTTSEPKVVQHADSTLIAGGVGLSMKMRPVPSDVGSIAFPYPHIGGPNYMVMILRCGLPTVLLEAFVIDQAIATFNQFGVSFAGGSTAHYLAFLAAQDKQPGTKIVPTLRLMAGGGAPKPPDIYFRAVEEMQVRILHGYGMTECPMIANGAWSDTDDQLAHSEGGPVFACEILIVGPDGEPVGAGVDGDVLVRGPMLAKGYADAEATTEAFRPDGFFRTGDRGHLRADGHITLTGRSKELIIRKGENISPKEIEDILSAHPRVAAVAVIGLPDAERGERVCAVVEMLAGAEPLTFVEMLEACREAKLMTQKTPEQLEVVDAMPRNPTMKILKRTLVERFSAPK
jgi:acyl-coenzyme A synthetase/AMP-(fatty) acid ligase